MSSATAERRGRRLVAIVMGAPSAAERTIKSAGLLEHGFSRLGWGGTTLDALPRETGMAPPDLRPVICGRNPPSSITLRQAGSERFAFASSQASATLLPQVDFAGSWPGNARAGLDRGEPPGADRAIPEPPRAPAGTSANIRYRFRRAPAFCTQLRGNATLPGKGFHPATERSIPPRSCNSVPV